MFTISLLEKKEKIKYESCVLTILMKALRMESDPPRSSEAEAVRADTARLRLPSKMVHTDSRTLITVPKLSRTKSLTNEKLTTPAGK